jgi:hypothetical protein
MDRGRRKQRATHPGRSFSEELLVSRLDRISVAAPYYGAEKNLGLYFGQSKGVGLMLPHQLASK